MASRSAAVDVLADLVGWEGKPQYTPDWSVSERLLGLALPEDYKALLNTIPVGKYAGTLLLGPPAIHGHEGDLMVSFRETMLRLVGKANRRYPLHPDVPGLVPWGRSSHPVASYLFWLADSGDANEWPVVVVFGPRGKWEQYDFGVAAFLIALIGGKLPSEIVSPRPGAPIYRTLQDMPGTADKTGS